MKKIRISTRRGQRILAIIAGLALIAGMMPSAAFATAGESGSAVSEQAAGSAPSAEPICTSEDLSGGALLASSIAATSGTWGDNLTWTYDTATATLTINGEGEMDGDVEGSSALWRYVRVFSPRRIIISEGVTSICEFAFED